MADCFETLFSASDNSAVQAVSLRALLKPSPHMLVFVPQCYQRVLNKPLSAQLELDHGETEWVRAPGAMEWAFVPGEELTRLRKVTSHS